MAKTNVKLSEAAKKKAIKRHNWALQWCWNYERMQNGGWLYSLMPALNKLYTKKEDR